ncbi:HbrB-like protein [Trichodelitschia bisporula]|uniref:HbrB-like protein n=1 Tax=Trichodelitschia bisporula TaxID=703511 RepID=A0A6G1IA12_9PEZI|nr:HbrB-like protein [Trichodelitschia bisporula]
MSSSPSKPPLSSPIALPASASGVNNHRQRTHSLSSDESDSSTHTTKITQSPQYHRTATLDPAAGNASVAANSSSSSAAGVHNFSRPALRPLNERDGSRQRSQSPIVEHSTATTPSTTSVWKPGHRPRQHSQGYYESAQRPPASPTQAGLSAAQIAAQQASMQLQGFQHNRKRSQTIPDPSAPPGQQPPMYRPPLPQTSATHAANFPSNPNLRNIDGFIGGHSLAAANAAFPARSPQYSPQLPPDRAPPPVPDKDAKPSKEKSKMKLFSKPKSIGIYKEKDAGGRHPALPSPNKLGIHASGAAGRLANASTTSLVDPLISGAASLYSSANASTSTLVPTEREKEKEKHKHHFLSRQKNKLRDKDDFHLPLSSANSNSKPTDPKAPQPLYSFAAPSSPGHSSTFTKSVSGLDLRHGGRALREKKKEEKSTLGPSSTSSTLLEAGLIRERDASFSQDRPMPSSFSSSSVFNPTASGSSLTLSADYSLTPAGIASIGTAFGMPGMSPDEAWPLLKAKALNIFEGEDPRRPIEDLNSLVSVHLRRCIQRRNPAAIIEDLDELLQTGFLSLDQTLRHVPDERLVPHLVAMWKLVFSTILPFLQAVFLPLDLEFKGRGPLMTAREAAEFWGAYLPDADPLGQNRNIPTLGEEFDVRRITLLTFRDTVILPRNDALMAIFSRLSLESINAGFSSPLPDPGPGLPMGAIDWRPSTAASEQLGPSVDRFGSYASLLGSVGDAASLASRSRAASNTSGASYSSVPSMGTSGSPALPPPPPPPLDSAQVTEMVGRMLQDMWAFGSNAIHEPTDICYHASLNVGYQHLTGTVQPAAAILTALYIHDGGRGHWRDVKEASARPYLVRNDVGESVPQRRQATL